MEAAEARRPRCGLIRSSPGNFTEGDATQSCCCPAHPSDPRDSYSKNGDGAHADRDNGVPGVHALAGNDHPPPSVDAGPSFPAEAVPAVRPCALCKHRPPLEGRRLCELCFPRQQARTKRLHEDRKAVGLCGTCGLLPPRTPRRAHCRHCLARFAGFRGKYAAERAELVAEWTQAKREREEALVSSGLTKRQGLDMWAGRTQGLVLTAAQGEENMAQAQPMPDQEEQLARARARQQERIAWKVAQHEKQKAREWATHQKQMARQRAKQAKQEEIERQKEERARKEASIQEARKRHRAHQLEVKRHCERESQANAALPEKTLPHKQPGPKAQVRPPLVALRGIPCLVCRKPAPPGPRVVGCTWCLERMRKTRQTLNPENGKETAKNTTAAENTAADGEVKVVPKGAPQGEEPVGSRTATDVFVDLTI